MQNVAMDLKHHIWENLEKNLNASNVAMLGLPATYPYKMGLLESWSKELMLAKGEANVKYTNKVQQVGNVTIEGVQKRGVCPSRYIPDVRNIHFLRPEQIQNLKTIGKGVQGEVNTCHVLDYPLIPKNVILVAKRFKEGDKHKR